MISRVLGVVIRERSAADKHEMIQGIHDGRVDTSFVRTLVKNPAIIVLFQWGLLENRTQNILVFHLTHAQDADGAVFRHGQDSFVHVVAFLVEAAFCPMLHALFSKRIVASGTIDKMIEEILHVPKSYTDRRLFPLCLTLNRKQEKQGNNQSGAAFHTQAIILQM